MRDFREASAGIPALGLVEAKPTIKTAGDQAPVAGEGTAVAFGTVFLVSEEVESTTGVVVTGWRVWPKPSNHAEHDKREARMLPR